MDSKQIHHTFFNKLYKANWLDSNEQLAKFEKEVAYYQLDIENLDKEDFINQITQFFGNDELFVAITVSKSFLLKPKLVFDEILNFLGKKGIGIANQKFDKLIFIDSKGSYFKLVVQDYPKTREKLPNTPISVEFYANMYETAFEKVSKTISPYFEQLQTLLNKDYGGNAERIWISIELIENNSEPFNFRFQKRVALGSPFGLYLSFVDEFYFYNVVSYSIQPDFKKLKTLKDKKEICDYVFNMIYQSFDIFDRKSKAMGGFDNQKFKSDFANACQSFGIEIK